MFFTSGMTLGYLLPASAPKPSFDKAAPATSGRVEEQTPESRERLIELERAFLTPWHLFY